nr:clumping factor A-like [Procambarus clarkii]
MTLLGRQGDQGLGDQGPRSGQGDLGLQLHTAGISLRPTQTAEKQEYDVRNKSRPPVADSRERAPTEQTFSSVAQQNRQHTRADSPYGTGVDSPYGTGVDSPYDTGADSPYDTGVDSPYDTGVESPYDTGVDSPYDTGVDSPYDTRADSPYDTGVDSPYDTGVDSPYDTRADSPYDTRADSPYDTGVDSPYDTGVDSPYDTGVDSPYDTGVDSPYDTGVDSPYDTGVDSRYDTRADSSKNSLVEFPRQIPPTQTGVIFTGRPAGIHPPETPQYTVGDSCEANTHKSCWYSRRLLRLTNVNTLVDEGDTKEHSGR